MICCKQGWDPNDPNDQNESKRKPWPDLCLKNYLEKTLVIFQTWAFNLAFNLKAMTKRVKILMSIWKRIEPWHLFLFLPTMRKNWQVRMRAFEFKRSGSEKTGPKFYVQLRISFLGARTRRTMRFTCIWGLWPGIFFSPLCGLELEHFLDKNMENWPIVT